MRIYHFTIVFAIFAAMMLFLTEVSLKQSADEERDVSFVNEAIDRASVSAADILSLSGASGIIGVRDLAVEAFYEATAAGLGLNEQTLAMTRLRLYVPFIAVTDGKIIYICYDRYETGKDGKKHLIREWSEPVSLDDGELPETLEYYCNLHNEVAKNAGIQYDFRFPQEEGGLFLRGSGGTAFFVLFQGYPVNDTSGKVINRFSFAGTAIRDAEQFFINTEGEGYASALFFHRTGCEYLSDNSIMFESRKECALHGAFECPACSGSRK